MRYLCYNSRMKICRTCKQEKSEAEFYALKKNKDGLHNECKPCFNLRSKTKYDSDESARERRKKHSKDARRERLDYIWNFLRKNPCVDCGQTDIRVLEFDHVVGEKVMGVTRAVQYSLEKVKQEIAKCEIRCANCHRIKTYTQLGWQLPDWIGEYDEQRSKELQFKGHSSD